VGGHNDLTGFLEIREDFGECLSDPPLVEVVFGLVDDEWGCLGERDEWKHCAAALAWRQFIDGLRAQQNPHLVIDQPLLELEDLSTPSSPCRSRRNRWQEVATARK
jgi:hypothetical protein